jgi:hypothetical protein
MKPFLASRRTKAVVLQIESCNFRSLVCTGSLRCKRGQLSLVVQKWKTIFSCPKMVNYFFSCPKMETTRAGWCTIASQIPNYWVRVSQGRIGARVATTESVLRYFSLFCRISQRRIYSS